MRENRPSGSEGGAGANPLFLPLSIWEIARIIAAIGSRKL
jgi:hypothetical protein